MPKKTINILLIFFFYLSLIAGFFLNEDLNGGARPDFESLDGSLNLINNFANNFKETFLNFDDFNERHSPLLIIIISSLTKLDFNLDFIRLLSLHVNLLSIFFFYQCLRIKFSDVKVDYLILISLIFFLSTNFRSLSIWPDSRAFGLLFFILSIKYFLKFQIKRNNRDIYKNIFFLALSSYFSPNFSLFAIYFFFHFLFITKEPKIFLKILFLNILLASPAFYYIFILDVNFIKFGLTPGTSQNISYSSVEFNISNKILCITSIIFFYISPLFVYLKKMNYEDKVKIVFLSLFFSIIYLFCVFNFNYQTLFTGGGIFFLISNYLFGNNFLLFVVCFLAFYFLFIRNFSFNNLFIIIILISSNPQLTIYHKYYDPLILVLMFSLFNFGVKKDFFNKKSISLLYLVNILFIFAKIGQKIL